MPTPPRDESFVPNTVANDAVPKPPEETPGRQSHGTNPDPADMPRFAAPTVAQDIGRLGKYRILRELGRGGMGAVYLAFDEKLQRKVAIKVMLPRAANDATARERFLREARAAARISNDHVVNIYEADEIDDTPYIALQYLQGTPLDEYLKKKGPPSIAQVMRVGRETALGLAAAHKLGMVHRDIKPGNIWLEAPSGRVKILDFGLAKPLQQVEGAELSLSGAVLGTPAYMSPEQGRGQAVDGRSDLFSLGCMLYRLLTGRLPFERGSLMDTLIAIGSEEATPVRQLQPAVPPALADLVRRMMAKSPQHRPTNAEAVVKELQTIRDGSTSTRAAPLVSQLLEGASDPWGAIELTLAESLVDIPALSQPPAKPKPWMWAAAGVAILAAVVAIGVIAVGFRDTNKTPTEVVRNAAPTTTAKVESPPAWTPVPISLRREDLSDVALTNVGDGDPANCPADLVGVFGDPGFRISGSTRYPAYSPDGSLLAVASGSDVVLFEATSGKRLRVLKPELHGDRISTVDFSADGTTLAAGQWNGRVRAWEVGTGREIMETHGHDGLCRSLKFAPDGATFLSAGEGGQLRIWKAGLPRALRTFRTPDSGHYNLSISPDGRFGAATGNGKGFIFDLETVNRRGAVELPDEEDAGVAFLSDSRVAFGSSVSIRSFDLENDGTPARTPASTLDGPGHWLAPFASSEILSGSHVLRNLPPALVRTDLSTGKELLRLPLPADDTFLVYALSKPRGEVAVLCHESGRYVHRIDLAKGAYAVKNPGHHMACYATAFSPDGRWLATGGRDRAVHVWEAATGKQVQGFRNLPGEVASLAFDPVHRQLVAALSSGELQVWQTDKWNRATVIPAHVGAINGIAFTSSGRLLATGGADGRIHLWNTANWARVDSLASGHPEGVRSIVALDDGQRFATTGNNGFVRIHSRSKGVEFGREVEIRPIRLAASADGRLLVTTTDAADKAPIIRTYNTTDMSEKSLPTTHWGHVIAVALRKDGRLLATSGDDGLIVVWDLATQPARRVVVHSSQLTGPIHSLTFAHDGQHLAAGTGCGLALVFRLPSEKESTAAWMAKIGPPPISGLSDADWEAAAAKLTAPNLGLAVADRLRERNPGMVWPITFSVEGGKVVRMDVTNTNAVTDIGALRALKNIRHLALRGANARSPDGTYILGGGLGKLTDLSPLRGLPLTHLDLIDNAQLTNLEPLSECRLIELRLQNTKVFYLQPLRGQPIRAFNSVGTPLTDLTPLATCPVEFLDIGWGQVRDLKPLRGSKVRVLNINNCGLSDLSGVEGMPLEELRIYYTGVADLVPLAGIPIVQLFADNTRVADLSPLMIDSLEVIHIAKTKVRDMSPLRDAPLWRIDTKKPADFWQEYDAKKP